jgi:uncharacterized RDD family membrane protein YckC
MDGPLPRNPEAASAQHPGSPPPPPAAPASHAGSPAESPTAAPPPAVAMTGRVTLGNGEVRSLASPGKRLGARIIDMVLLSIGSTVVLTIGFSGGALIGAAGTDAAIGAAIGTFFITVILILLLTIVYEVTLTALRGQTLGKMAMGIVVVGGEDGALPGWGKAIIRWALPHLMFLIPMIGWLAGLATWVSLTWDDRRQGWHDKAAATVVINS